MEASALPAGEAVAAPPLAPSDAPALRGSGSGSQQAAGECDSAPSPAPPVRPPPGVRVFVVEPLPTHLQCPICHDAFTDPHALIACSHTFCANCIDAALARRPTCPYCRVSVRDAHTTTGPLARPNLVAAWGVDELLVRCRFGLRHAPAPGREPWLVDEDGCAATLRLAAVASHEREDCAFAPVRCMHADPETDEQCFYECPRGDMAAHTAQCSLRSVACGFCAKLTAADNEASHAEVCPRRPTPCHAGCGASVPRASLARHLETDCPEAEVECPYAGCGARFRRAEAEEHADSMLGAHLAGERAARVALERRLNAVERRMRVVETSQRANWANTLAAVQRPPPPSSVFQRASQHPDVLAAPPSGRRRARELRPLDAGFRAVVPRPAVGAPFAAAMARAHALFADDDGGAVFIANEANAGAYDGADEEDGEGVEE